MKSFKRETGLIGWRVRVLRFTIGFVRSSNDVTKVLNDFKSDMGFGKPTPQEQVLDKAKAVAEPKLPKSKPDTSAGQKVWSAADIKAMSLSDFENYRGEIMEAWAQDNIRR